MNHCLAIQNHYRKCWSGEVKKLRWRSGPVHELPKDFLILQFPPARKMWTYATCCMSQAGDESPLEIHLFSPEESLGHVELLTVISHYHRTGARIGPGHTVNFGKPWMEGSRCDHGLLSLPYLDGPQLE